MSRDTRLLVMKEVFMEIMSGMHHGMRYILHLHPIINTLLPLFTADLLLKVDRLSEIGHHREIDLLLAICTCHLHP